ncbi:hypothetical protein H9P43_005530 [Blastocladiella emersonii ATCC 22665]|nr:hypothetical protein H9P43_005530 [Blastocladiella emersonii ATCC 22665]
MAANRLGGGASSSKAAALLLLALLAALAAVTSVAAQGTTCNADRDCDGSFLNSFKCGRNGICVPDTCIGLLPNKGCTQFDKGLFCDLGTCKPRKNEGSSCSALSAEDECADGLKCRSGKCAGATTTTTSTTSTSTRTTTSSTSTSTTTSTRSTTTTSATRTRSATTTSSETVTETPTASPTATALPASDDDAKPFLASTLGIVLMIGGGALLVAAIGGFALNRARRRDDDNDFGPVFKPPAPFNANANASTPPAATNRPYAATIEEHVSYVTVGQTTSVEPPVPQQGMQMMPMQPAVVTAPAIMMQQQQQQQQQYYATGPAPQAAWVPQQQAPQQMYDPNTGAPIMFAAADPNTASMYGTMPAPAYGYTTGVPQATAAYPAGQVYYVVDGAGAMPPQQQQQQQSMQSPGAGTMPPLQQMSVNTAPPLAPAAEFDAAAATKAATGVRTLPKD